MGNPIPNYDPLARPTSRRAFLKIVGLATGGLALAACTPGVSTPPASGTPGPSGSQAPLALTESTPAPSSDPNAKKGGMLRLARDQDPTSLDPAHVEGNNNLFIQAALFDSLVNLEPGFTDPQPGLASSYKVSDDSLTYTFTLRDGIKFCNGSPITAEDVVFCIERAMDPEQDDTFAFLYVNFEGIKAIDAKTIEVKTKIVDASCLSTLAMPCSGIYPKAVFEQMGATKFGQQPIGSGAFMLQTWTQGDKEVLVKNPYYWKTGKPYLDGVTFTYVADTNARILQMKTGETDVAQSIPYAQVTSLQNQPGYSIQLSPYAVCWNLWLNRTVVKAFQDKLVRQALNYATPRDSINQAVLGGMGLPQNSMYGKSNYWDPDVPAYPYDIEKAKQLMAQSSVPQGFSFSILYPGGNNAQEQTATILQAAYAQIGVKVTLKTADQAGVNKEFQGMTFDTIMMNPSDVSSDIPDSSEQAAIFLKGEDKRWNGFYTGYINPEASKLVDEAGTTLDPAKRKELYRQLQQLSMDDAAQVALLFTPVVTGVSNKVHGFQTMINGWWRLEDVWLDQ